MYQIFYDLSMAYWTVQISNILNHHWDITIHYTKHYLIQETTFYGFLNSTFHLPRIKHFNVYKLDAMLSGWTRQFFLLAWIKHFKITSRNVVRLIYHKNLHRKYWHHHIEPIGSTVYLKSRYCCLQNWLLKSSSKSLQPAKKRIYMVPHHKPIFLKVTHPVI